MKRKMIFSLKKLFFRTIIFLVAVIVFFTIFCIYLNYKQHEKIEGYIKTGRLQYFPEIGWVDWGHAISNGPKILVRDMLLNFGTVSYHQQMTIRKLGVNITIRLTNTYRLPENFSEKNRQGMIHFIFSDVCADFENLQASFPFQYTCGTGIGDRNGDNISLLRSLRKSRTEPELFRPVSRKRALQLYKEGDKKDRVNPIFERRLGFKIKVKKIASKTELILGT